MRRLSLLLLLSVLVLPSVALAARSVDGSLVVSNASGTITVQGKGPIFGHFERGTMTVVEYKPDRDMAVSVSGAKRSGVGNVATYSGNGVRFLLPGGKYTLIFDGAGIDISAVGKGTVSVTGRGSSNDGSFSVNGAKAQSITSTAVRASFGGVATVTAEKGTSTSSRSS